MFPFNLPSCIPDKPYMIVLGTSHINGDCSNEAEGVVQETAYQRIAKEVGLEIVNIGLSGCTNEDLLQATNELAYNGYLNPLCKLFVLEPRINTTAVYIPSEIVSGEPETPEYVSIIEGWGRTRDGHTIAGTCTRQRMSCQVKVVPVNEMKAQSWWQSGKTITPAAAAALEYFANNLETNQHILDNLIIIDAINNIVQSNNIKFRWQFFDYDKPLETLTNVYNTNTNMWDNFMDIFGWKVKKETGMNWITDDDGKEILNPYFCECYHLSALGHDKWYENTIPYIKKALENNH